MERIKVSSKSLEKGTRLAFASNDDRTRPKHGIREIKLAGKRGTKLSKALALPQACPFFLVFSLHTLSQPQASEAFPYLLRSA